jgi:hypothetical protein
MIIWYYELEHVDRLNTLYYGKLYEGLSLIEYVYDNNNTLNFKIPTKITSTSASTIENITYPKNVEIADLHPKKTTIENFDADSDLYQRRFESAPLWGTLFNSVTSNLVENPEKKTEFTQKYCKHGQLMHLGENVKPDCAEHVYSELVFYNKTCNVCDKSCIFSVIDTDRLKTDELLTRPHDSNDWFSTVWENLRNLFPGGSNYENMQNPIFFK